MSKQHNPWKYAALAALAAGVLRVKVDLSMRRQPQSDDRLSFGVPCAFGNSPAECEENALAQAREFFGPEAALSLFPSRYHVVPVEDIYEPEAGGKKFRTSGGLCVYADAS